MRRSRRVCKLSADSRTREWCDLRLFRLMSGGTVAFMWDVLTWHNGTLSIAWWAVIVLVFLMLVVGGSHAARK